MEDFHEQARHRAAGQGKQVKMIPDEYVRLAETLADTARTTAQRISSEPEMEIKADGTPVTTVDRAVETALRRVIEREQPGHGILGEEFGAEGADRDWVWVLDPVDGTRQFAAGLPNFGTLIALCREGRPVIGVIAHLFYESTCIGVAGRGTRVNRRPVRCAGPDRLSEIVACISDPDAFDARTTPGMQAIRTRTRWNVFDGGCLGYASLARGLVGLCLNGPNLEPFDIAALVPVVEAAGGRITDWRGNALTIESEGEIVASSGPRLHEGALEVLSSVPQ